MTAFLDTSSLCKLYNNETDSDEFVEFIVMSKITSFFLTEQSIVEFSSAIWKKCLIKDIDFEQASFIQSKFNDDLQKFNFIADSFAIKLLGVKLIEKYWHKGLRTLDSIQLSSALSIKDQISLFCTHDQKLNEIASIEGFKTIK